MPLKAQANNYITVGPPFQTDIARDILVTSRPWGVLSCYYATLMPLFAGSAPCLDGDCTNFIGENVCYISQTVAKLADLCWNKVAGNSCWEMCMWRYWARYQIRLVQRVPTPE